MDVTKNIFELAAILELKNTTDKYSSIFCFLILCEIFHKLHEMMKSC